MRFDGFSTGHAIGFVNCPRLGNELVGRMSYDAFALGRTQPAYGLPPVGAVLDTLRLCLRRVIRLEQDSDPQAIV